MLIINKKLYVSVAEASRKIGISRERIHRVIKRLKTRTIKFEDGRWKEDKNVKIVVEVKE